MEQYNKDLIRRIVALEYKLDNLPKLESSEWVDWTPTVTQTGNVTKTITYARYIIIDSGKVTVSCKMLITGTGTAGSIIVVSGIPISAKYTGDSVCVGSAIIKDTGTAFYECAVEMSTATTIRFLGYNVVDYVGAVPNFGLAANDIISFTITYEKA